MKFVFVAVGSDGDINPMIEIARELFSRGHKVEFLANGHFAYKCHDIGLPFVEMGGSEHYWKALELKEVWDKRKGFAAMWQLVYNNMPIAYEIIESRVEVGRTILVGSTLALAARVLQEVKQVPMCTVHLAPACILSKCDPPKAPDVPSFSNSPSWLKSLYIELLDKFILEKVCRDDLNVFRGRYGLPPVSKVFSKWLHAPEKVICAFPQWFAQPQADWPANAVCTGFPLTRASSSLACESLSEGTQRFIDQGAPPVVFTAGSAMNHSAPYFEKALAAVSAQRQRAIFISKFPSQIPVRLPEYVHHALYEPFDLLFSQVSAVAHHGGIGTSAQCLQAGVKQLITPFSHDQFDNSKRLAKLGVAAELPFAKSARHWQKVVGKVVEDPRYAAACKAAKALMPYEERSVEFIAGEIESLIGRALVAV
jgi:rhamnosyltransferase subunit B